VVELV
jgi:hypothetical protein